jgi:hypothetical protein
MEKSMSVRTGTIAILLIMSAAVISAGCATVIKGYEDEVLIVNGSDSLRVFSESGIEHRVEGTMRKIALDRGQAIPRVYVDSLFRSIRLHSNETHTLVLKSGQQEKRVEVYPRLGGWWFILDALTLGVFIDWYTGCWNHFAPIDAGMAR